MVPDMPPPKRGKEPYYVQVANILRARIASQDDSRPYLLEPEYDLCTTHGVSRITIRKALDVLEQEGLIERKPRRGTVSIPEAVRRYKNLRGRRTIHLICQEQAPPISNPATFYGQVYQGILAAVERAGCLMSGEPVTIMGNSLPPPPRPPASDALGFILVGVMTEPLIQAYAELDLPLVCVDYWTSCRKADVVVVDCFDEGQQAAELLLRQGHRHLFYLGNKLQRGTKEADADLLLAGLQRVLELSGLPPLPPERIRYCKSARHEPVDAEVDYLLSLHPRPTAGVVFNTHTLSRMIERLAALNIRCPEDISLVGKTSDIDPTSCTCLRASPRTLGQVAVDCLLQRATGKRDAPVRLAMLSRLHLGNSVTYYGQRPARPYGQ